MKKNKVKYNISNRIIFVLVIFMLLVLIYVGKLLELQVFGGDQYKAGAIEQKRAVVELAADRGDIYDSEGNVLAQTVTVNTCYLFPETLKMNEDYEKYVDGLSKALGLEKKAIMDKVESGENMVELKSGLSQEEVDKVNQVGLYNSINIVKENDRFYPEGKSMSHLLGFVDDTNRGLYGVEREANEALSGKKGIKVFSRDSRGRIIPYESYEEYSEEAGQNVILTVNSRIQNIVYEAVENVVKESKPDKVTAIVTDPNTGKILAMENYPSFDKNNPRELFNKSKDEKKNLERLYKLWSNPAVSDVYEPGSVFKPLTVAIGLETKSVDENKKYLCEGFYEIVPGVTIKCWRYWEPHGEETIKEALANSCNPAFVQIIEDIGIDRFTDYLNSLHINGKTGIDLPSEQGGLTYSKENIGPVELATMSYGHGVSITPLQMIQAENAVINGGYYFRPYVIDSYVDKDGNVLRENNPEVLTQVFSKETSEKMRDYLIYTVENGASSGVYIDGYTIGGKSGTTETVDEKEGEYSAGKTIASFYGCFPGDDPKYSVLVVVDNPKGDADSGDGVASPVVKEILEKIIRLEESENTFTDIKNKDNTKYVGMSVGEAIEKLDNKEDLYEIVGEYNLYNPIIEENLVDKDDEKVIELKVDQNKFVVPDFSKFDDLLEISDIFNLEIINGESFSQSIEKGTIIDENEKIVITMEG